MQAARRAEHKHQWKTALKEWKAAYAVDVNAEYLIGIGDAYAHLGNKAEARKSYEAYLADPLALPANASKVKAKVASLDAGSGPALALPGPGLDLPGAAPKKAADPLALPGLDLPPAKTATAANDKKPEPLALPGLDLPAPKKEQPKTVASASPDLDLPLPGAAPKKEPAVSAQPAKTPAKTVAVATPPGTRPASTATAAGPTRVPDAAIGDVPSTHPQPQASSGGTRRVVAYVAAGVAVLALGGSAYAYSKASSASSDLTGSKHTGAAAHDLLDQEKSNKTLSFVGLAGGLVAGGLSVALFAF